MEFWGVEVKPGETVKCDIEENKYLHVSQGSLGESKKDKGSEKVLIWVKFDGKKILLGTVSDTCPQITYDLIFEREFELSHTSKNASVHFVGYKTAVMDEDDDDASEFDDLTASMFPQSANANGKADKKDELKASAKADGTGSKSKPQKSNSSEMPAKVDSDDEEDDGDEDDEESDDLGSDDEEMAEDDDSDEDEDGDDDLSEDEETPKKVESSKKRPAAPSEKTPAGKKAKVVSPASGQKTGGDGKKNVHQATPHPSKPAAKASANKEKQSPKSAGQVTCQSCKKSFNSEKSLQDHSKAKHGDAK